MLSLKEKCIIVQLSTSHWSAKKYSPKVTQEIDEQHQSYKSGRFNKTLMISNKLDEISTCVNMARGYHYKVTLPWDDAGQRLLPVDAYLDYVAKMEEYKLEHQKLVDAFINNYPELRKEAKKRLNTLFDEADYPFERELYSKFSIDYNFTPVADSNDLRVSVSKDEAKEIKKNIEAGLQEKINNSKQSIVDKALKAVELAREKFKDEDATFRDTLITNITDLVDTIPIINFDEDATLIELRKKLKKLDLPADSLRKDKDARKEAAKKCKKIIAFIKTINFTGVKTVPVNSVPQKAKRLK